MAQATNPLTESYMMSAFKGCLSEHYRRYADEQYNFNTLNDLILALMIWEQTFEDRERHLKCPSCLFPNLFSIYPMLLTWFQIETMLTALGKVTFTQCC